MRTVIATASVLLVASSVLAGPPEKGKDVTEIVRAVDETTKKCEQITYDWRFMPLVEGSNIPSASGQVKAIQGSDMESSPFWIEIDNPTTDGPIGSNPSTIVGFDGDNFYQLDYANKKLQWGAAETGGAALAGTATRYMMIEFVHPTPFSDELNGESLKLEGTKKIGDVECDVVHVVYAESQGEARWYFGQKDHLPHRVDRISGGYAVELTNVNPKVKLKATDFALKAPEGFTTTEYKTPEAPKPLAVGSDAPDWELQSGEGKTVRLKDLRGNIVLIDFWATWCGPCKMAMPGVQKLHEHFKDQKVKILGISTWENGDKVNDPIKYMKDQKFTYGLLVEGDDVAAAYKVRGIPTFYLIDKDGKIAYVNVGYDPKGEEKLVKIIDELLAKDGI